MFVVEAVDLEAVEKAGVVVLGGTELWAGVVAAGVEVIVFAWLEQPATERIKMALIRSAKIKKLYLVVINSPLNNQDLLTWIPVFTHV